MAHRSESLQNWNPMQKDYEDPNFNTYREGPGAQLDLDKQPCFSGKSGRKSGPFKLFVGNIPANIDKDGIENIFSNVGKPFDIYRKPPESKSNYTWAFVSFATYREADSAIREIHVKPPLRLKVEFSRSNDMDERVPIKPRKTYSTPDTEENSKQRQSFSRTSEPSGKGRGLVLKPFEDPRAVGDGLLGRDPNDMKKFQPYSGSKYDESNTSIMRGVQRANGPKGPKKFVMGRGCFDRDLDEIVRPQQIKPIALDVRATLENYVQSVNGHYEFGKKEFPRADIQGTCTLCAREATQFCQRCSDWYCSRACQETDWPRHKRYCLPPALVSAHQRSEEPARERIFERKSLGSQSDLNGAHSVPQMDRKGDSNSLHLKDSSVAASKGKDVGYTNRKSTNFRGNISHDRNDSVRDARQDEGNELKNVQSKEKSQRTSLSPRPANGVNSSRDASVKSKHSPQRRFEDSSGKETPDKIENNDKKENISFSKKAENDELYKLHEELSESSYTAVKVEIPLGPYEFWVQKAENVLSIYSLSSEMEKYKDSPLIKPIVGAYCMAYFEKMWFRGKVTSIKPQIMIHYIDFGNEDPAEVNELRELPDVVKNLKTQAMKIRLAPGTSDQYKDIKEGDTLKVKFAYKKNDVNFVLVEGEEYDDLPGENSSNEIALQNVLVLLKQKMRCYVFITEYNDPEDFVSSLVPGHLIDCYNGLFYGTLKEECESNKEKYVPQLGEAIIGKFSEGWLRGVVVYISSADEYIVASCDTGLVECVNEVRKMPKKLREIAQFAVHCRVLTNIHKAKKLITETKKLSVIVRNVTSDCALGYIESADKEIICDIEIKKWAAPFELYEDLKCVELIDGPCVVTAHMSAVDLYIRPLTLSCIETFNLILQDVPKHCFLSQALDHVPKVGEVLAAEFSEDKTYYRAIVREVHRTKGVKVQYIDFGNIEYVSQGVLKPLSEKLRSKECLAVKVKLKDVVEYPVNEDALRYFKDLIVSEKKLVVKLNSEGGNEVNLYEADGSLVNDKLNRMLQPQWKKKDPSIDPIYTIDDLVFEELDVGSHVDLAISSVIDYNSILVRRFNSKSFRELKSHLESTMCQYCTEIDEPYTPRPDELCLAELDGVWYRCCCLEGGTNLNLLFLDTGEAKLVPHKRIRRMPKDFINLPICGLFCKVKTSVVISSKEAKETVEEFFRISKMINAEVLESDKICPRHTYLIKVEELDQYLNNLIH